MEPKIKRAWIRVIIFFITLIIVFLASKIILQIVVHLTHFEPGFAYKVLISETFIVLFVFLLVYLFRRYLDRKSFISLGFDYHGKFREMMIGALLGFLLMAIGFIVLLSLGNLEITRINFNWLYLIIIFLGLFVAALFEEIVFRGYMLNNLMESFNRYIALGITAVLFGMVHSFNPNFTIMGLVNIIIGGWLFGLYYIHQKNLWFPILLHLSWNFFQGPIFGFAVSGEGEESQFLIEHQIEGSKILTGGKFGFEGSIILTILLIIVITGMHYIFWKKSEHPSSAESVDSTPSGKLE
jgi:membrane protease YdiL (CAAX protease family)